MYNCVNKTKEYLKNLSRIENGVGNLKACTVTYCSFSFKAENRIEFRHQCRPDSVYWSFQTVLLEARNSAHAKVVFSESEEVEGFDPSIDLSIAFESATCE